MEATFENFKRTCAVTDITSLLPARIQENSEIRFAVVQGTEITVSGIKPMFIAVKTSDVLPTLLNPKIIKLIKEVQQYFCPNCPVTYQQLLHTGVQLEFTLIPIYSIVYKYQHIANFIDLSKINYTYVLPYQTRTFTNYNHVLICEPNHPVEWQSVSTHSVGNHSIGLSGASAMRLTVPIEAIRQYVHLEKVLEPYQFASILLDRIKLQLYSRLVDRGLNEREIDTVMKNFTACTILNYFPDKYTVYLYETLLNYPSSYITGSITLDV